MFNSLLKLHSNRVPLEDFSTEALSGILLSRQNILDKFVNQILKVTGENFSLETQKPYLGSRVDMVFENKESIIFLENKVNAQEGYEQLSKYAKILCHQNKNYYLRFCTKYIEVKSEDKYFPLEKKCFHQFRWHDIYSFLANSKEIKDDSLVKYFLNFLEKKEMSRASEFSVDDLISLRRFPSAFKSIEDSINSITPSFAGFFGDISNCTKAGLLNQLSKNNRYAIWQDNALTGGYSEILLSFNLGDYDHQYPLLNLHVWTSKNHKLYDQIISDIEINAHLLPKILTEKKDIGFEFSYKDSLSNFISSNNQFNDIQSWFEEKMKTLHNYMLESELPWNIKK